MGAAVWPGGQPSPTLVRRTRAAAALYRDGHVDLLVPTGGLGQHPPTEAEAMIRILRAEGVPGDAILPEDRATTTMESAVFVARLLSERGIDRATVVSDTYHLPRCWLAFRSQGWRCGLQAAGRASPRPKARIAARAWAREAAALPYYAWRILRHR